MKKLLAVLLLLPAACLAAEGKRYDASIIGAMDGSSLADTYEELRAASNEKKELTLRIMSQGGSAFSTLLFIELVRDLKAEQGLHITCVGTAMVASAADGVIVGSAIVKQVELNPQNAAAAVRDFTAPLIAATKSISSP